MRAPRSLLLSAVGILATLTGASAAFADDFPAVSPYVGAFGGVTIPLSDWQLGRATQASSGTELLPKTSPGAGLRLGLQVIPQLAFEIAGQWIPLSTTNGTTNTVVSYEAAMVLHFLSGPVSPYATLGAGFYQSLTKGTDALGTDGDPRAHLGLGVRGLVGNNVALRLEGRGVLTDGFVDPGAFNAEILGGIDLFLTSSNVHVEIATEAPDRDKDGVVDAKDKCPDVPGDPALDGCPDKDKDGIADADDQCPNDPGPKELGGCPDKDKDGVIDSKDKCPNVPGDPALDGCPDTDKDGIADAEDRCPKDAGPKELMGCPDRDGDKVVDIDDKCPDLPGLLELQGCLPDAVSKFSGVIKGINFKLGSAVIQASSFKLLDDAASVLAEYKALKLRISGHTDNVGKSDKNQKLSEDRAGSVKTYLMKKGIDESRLDAKGFGDSKPVQDNKTATGRAANRRIEFEILAQ